MGANEAFEIVVLSDSTNADAWIRETVAIDGLRRSLASVMPVWYRRRWRNVARKSGNLEDFVTRWGGRYDHMIVLDADSLIDAPTLTRLVQMMHADPALGILQTAPQLIGARTFFGRLQQFAACAYGPVISRGLAAWSGDSANYWGHNAIIRVRAFADCCGLPELEGRKPFGGHVLSHDFVEAALMRRGGWKVRMATDCGGSWEESPPSLIDVAIRDRRWAQGNLQHMKIIGASGLSFASRLHLGIGIMSYLSSPLWLRDARHRIRARRAVAPDPPGIFQSRLPDVSDLASVQRGAHDGAVLVQHGRAADSEDARVDPRADLDEAAARRRRRHRHRRKLPVRGRAFGSLRAGDDDAAKPPCLRGVPGTRLRLESAEARRRRHELGRCLALPQARHAARRHDRRDLLVPVARAARLGIAGAARPSAGGAAVARERQRMARRRPCKVALLRTPEEVERALAGRPARGIDRDGAPPSRRRAEVPRAKSRGAAGAHRGQSSPSRRSAGPSRPGRLHRAAEARRCPLPGGGAGMADARRAGRGRRQRAVSSTSSRSCPTRSPPPC